MDQVVKFNRMLTWIYSCFITPIFLFPIIGEMKDDASIFRIFHLDGDCILQIKYIAVSWPVLDVDYIFAGFAEFSFPKGHLTELQLSQTAATFLLENLGVTSLVKM